MPSFGESQPGAPTPPFHADSGAGPVLQALRTSPDHARKASPHLSHLQRHLLETESCSLFRNFRPHFRHEQRVSTERFLRPDALFPRTTARHFVQACPRSSFGKMEFTRRDSLLRSKLEQSYLHDSHFVVSARGGRLHTFGFAQTEAQCCGLTSFL